MGLGQVASNREKTGVFLVSNRAAVKIIEQQHTVRYSVSGGGGGTTHRIYADFAFAYLCLPYFVHWMILLLSLLVTSFSTKFSTTAFDSLFL